MKLHYQLAVELRQAARANRERDLVRCCNRYMKGEATEQDRLRLATACWPLLGKDVTP